MEDFDLYSSDGVKRILRSFPNIEERMYQRGDYDACIILIDLKRAVSKADLGNRQSQVVEMWKEGYKYIEIAKKLNLDESTIRESLDAASKKIAKIYKEWGYFDE